MKNDAISTFISEQPIELVAKLAEKLQSSINCSSEIDVDAIISQLKASTPVAGHA